MNDDCFRPVLHFMVIIFNFMSVFRLQIIQDSIIPRFAENVTLQNFIDLNSNQ